MPEAVRKTKIKNTKTKRNVEEVGKVWIHWKRSRQRIEKRLNH
jgi:hypothetical protein